MRHLRGLNLRPHRDEIVYLGFLANPEHVTFEEIPEWHALGGCCAACEREGWVNRHDLSIKWGKTTYLGSLARLLRCLGCGNKGNNRWIYGKLPR